MRRDPPAADARARRERLALRRTPGGPRRRPAPGLRASHEGARARLRAFRQGTALAVALTAIILLVWGIPEVIGQEPDVAAPPGEPLVSDPAVSLEQAAITLQELILGFYGLLPKLVLALLLVGIAALVSRLAGALIFRRMLGHWEKAEAARALLTIGIYLSAIAIALSILAGDARALLGSVGLIGLALSWALQTPIESFTGWLLNSLRSYYRVGDRIEVGEVFGDVYKIDVLTTTVWEAGGPGKAVAGAQPTGAMITFPNWEVLRSNIVNYSRDFPFVWDEVTIPVTNESDLPYTIGLFERTAVEIVGDGMADAASRYQSLLTRARLSFDVDERPRVFVSLAESWVNCTVRYLVPARERRRRASELIVALSAAAADPAHAARVVPAYPRQEVHLTDWSAGGNSAS